MQKLIAIVTYEDYITGNLQVECTNTFKLNQQKEFLQTLKQMECDRQLYEYGYKDEENVDPDLIEDLSDTLFTQNGFEDGSKFEIEYDDYRITYTIKIID